VGSASEERGSVHLLPVVFDSEGVFPDQVFGKLVDRCRNALRFAFEGALRPAFESGVGGYSNQSRAITRRKLVNSCNFHFLGLADGSGRCHRTAMT